MAKPKKTASQAPRGLRLAAVDGNQVEGSAPALRWQKTSPPPLPEFWLGERLQPLNKEGGNDPSGDGAITPAEVAVWADDKLRYFISIIRGDLAVVEAELRLRQEAVEMEMKRMRRSVVDAEDRLDPGEMLISEAGNPIFHTYCGTSWKLTAAAAKQRGLPEMAGRMVKYAYGKPLTEDATPVSGRAGNIAPFLVRRVPADTPSCDLPF